MQPSPHRGGETVQVSSWRNTGSKTSYVQFLEARVMEMQAQLAPPTPRRGPTP